jgi:hypothetical protein
VFRAPGSARAGVGLEPENQDDGYGKGDFGKNEATRAEPLPAKPADDGDEWYLRTGQPAPQRTEDGEEPLVNDEIKPVPPVQIAMMILVAVVFVLILVFGVFLA